MADLSAGKPSFSCFQQGRSGLVYFYLVIHLAPVAAGCPAISDIYLQG
jgi:hypothetical protein